MEIAAQYREGTGLPRLRGRMWPVKCRSSKLPPNGARRVLRSTAPGPAKDGCALIRGDGAIAIPAPSDLIARSPAQDAAPRQNRYRRPCPGRGESATNARRHPLRRGYANVLRKTPTDQCRPGASCLTGERQRSRQLQRQLNLSRQAGNQAGSHLMLQKCRPCSSAQGLFRPRSTYAFA